MGRLSNIEFNGEIGKRLLAVRMNAGLAQNAFAERLGVSPRAYQNWERGEREIQAGLLPALYEEFDIDPLWILTGPGEQPVHRDARPNFDLVEEVVLAVELWLQRRHKMLIPKKKAQLVALLYKHFLNEGKVGEEHLHSMMQLIA